VETGEKRKALPILGYRLERLRWLNFAGMKLMVLGKKKLKGKNTWSK